ncbi:hypothetical protein [Fangia hongkongensis]|uniref:hypothetical protein n=1 Tax=Fangia hongkongensis TaxID=270495 RepID=UPI00037FCFE2|nr:hypothetical protein [Fangia hongkongensis]
MANQDFASLIKAEELTLDTTIVDMQGANALTFVFNHANNSVVTVTDGDESNLSDGATVDAKWLIGDTTFTAAGVGVIGYVGKKRYIKINMTNPVANTSTYGIKSSLYEQPAS